MNWEGEKGPNISTICFPPNIGRNSAQDTEGRTELRPLIKGPESPTLSPVRRSARRPVQAQRGALRPLYNRSQLCSTLGVLDRVTPDVWREANCNFGHLSGAYTLIYAYLWGFAVCRPDPHICRPDDRAKPEGSCEWYTKRINMICVFKIPFSLKRFVTHKKL